MGTTADEAVRTEHQTQGAMNVTVRNVITSMRMISAVDWAEFFESVSLIDAALRVRSDFLAVTTIGINAILSTPLLARKQPVGALNFYSRTPSAFAARCGPCRRRSRS